MAFLVVDDTVLYSISGSIFSAINFLSYLHHLYFVVLLEVTANIGKIAVKKNNFWNFGVMTGLGQAFWYLKWILPIQNQAPA